MYVRKGREGLSRNYKMKEGLGGGGGLARYLYFKDISEKHLKNVRRGGGPTHSYKMG